MNPANRHPPASSRPAAARLERAEGILLLAGLGLIALALLTPPIALPSGYHDFADQRVWFGLPNAMDVLSNLAFALLGLLGWRALRRLPEAQLDGRRRTLVKLFFAGLVLTTFTSGYYHLSPDDSRLAVDRLGISLAFAGLLGLAAADRVSPRAGAALALLIGLAAPAAALWDAATGNMTPWTVVQAAGLALLAGAGLAPPAVRSAGLFAAGGAGLVRRGQGHGIGRCAGACLDRGNALRAQRQASDRGAGGVAGAGRAAARRAFGPAR